MNACIRAAVRAALDINMEIFGIQRGYAGLILGQMIPLDRRAVANIIHQGGTILGTARSEEFRTKEGRAKAIQQLKQAGIEGLVLIGGDGTFRGGTLLSEESNLPIIGIPGTIDNDVYGSDYTIGFDSAVNCALSAIDRIRDTAQSHERLFFIEVMGRHTGFIAVESGVAGGAEELFIPEIPMNIDQLAQGLKEDFARDKKSAIVVVAEGETPGHTFQIADEVRKKIDVESRVCVLGHVQRGGAPTARDRVLSSMLGVAAVRALADGKSNSMVGEIKGEISFTPLKDTWEKKKQISPFLKEIAELLCR